MIGKKFNKLTLIEKLFDDNNHEIWLCLCDCGIKKEIRLYNVIYGKTKSCGCLVKCDQPQDVSFNDCYNSDRYSAKKRNLLFLLTKEEHKELISKECTYCGQISKRAYSPYFKKDGSLSKNAIKLSISLDYAKQTLIYINGIDRKDSSIGYVIDNCTTACSMCNFMKKEYNVDTFLEHVNNISNYQKAKHVYF